MIYVVLITQNFHNTDDVTSKGRHWLRTENNRSICKTLTSSFITKMDGKASCLLPKKMIKMIRMFLFNKVRVITLSVINV